MEVHKTLQWIPRTAEKIFSSLSQTYASVKPPALWISHTPLTIILNPVVIWQEVPEAYWGTYCQAVQQFFHHMTSDILILRD